jgi:hypothetical protein
VSLNKSPTEYQKSDKSLLFFTVTDIDEGFEIPDKCPSIVSLCGFLTITAFYQPKINLKIEFLFKIFCLVWSENYIFHF